MSTPQLRSRQNLTERGYLVATVEGLKRFPDKKRSQCRACGHIPLIEIKSDMWGCFDLVAEHPQSRERIYVQVTGDSGGNHAKRRNTILSSFEAKLVLMAGARILIQSWKKVNNRFQVREEEIFLADYTQAPHYPNTVAELMEIRRKEKKPYLPKGATLPLMVEPAETPVDDF